MSPADKQNNKEKFYLHLKTLGKLTNRESDPAKYDQEEKEDMISQEQEILHYLLDLERIDFRTANNFLKLVGQFRREEFNKQKKG